jgi:hypothetical protein
VLPVLATSIFVLSSREDDCELSRMGFVPSILAAPFPRLCFGFLRSRLHLKPARSAPAASCIAAKLMTKLDQLLYSIHADRLIDDLSLGRLIDSAITASMGTAETEYRGVMILNLRDDFGSTVYDGAPQPGTR